MLLGFRWSHHEEGKKLGKKSEKPLQRNYSLPPPPTPPREEGVYSFVLSCLCYPALSMLGGSWFMQQSLGATLCSGGSRRCNKKSMSLQGLKHHLACSKDLIFTAAKAQHLYSPLVFFHGWGNWGLQNLIDSWPVRLRKNMARSHKSHHGPCPVELKRPI